MQQAKFCARLVLVLLVAMGAVSTADAQETYRLDGDHWRPVTRVDPASAEGQLLAARRELAADKPKHALKLIDAWIEQYPTHHLLPEAHLLRGDALVASNNEYKALYEYEIVIRQYPGSEQYMTALEREYAIAQQYASGMRRKWLGMRLFDAKDVAEEIFIRIQERAPGSALGEDASLTLGEYYYAEGEMRSAVAAYDMFLVNYPRSERRERVMLRLIQANLATYKGPRYDATGLLEAAERIRQYRDEYPASAERLGADALLVRIDDSMALQLYYGAQWYDQRGLDVSAVTMYRRVLSDYPDTTAASLAMQRLERAGVPIVARGRSSQHRATRNGDEP